jgi:TPR repeat protein
VRGEGRDEKKARQLFQKACDDGDLRGCTRLGRMVERGRGGWVKDEAARTDGVGIDAPRKPVRRERPAGASQR